MPGGLDPRGPVAGEIAGLWWLMFWLGTVVFVVFMIAGWIALVRTGPGRNQDAPRANDDEARAETTRYVRRWVFGAGGVMTTLVLVVVLVFTIASMRAIPQALGGDALRLELVAHQWYWDVRYPTHDVTTRNVVRIPVGREVELLITSADVIHSFWVPSLAGKMDAVPRRTNSLVLQADEVGTYRGQCAEFCGLKHATMRVSVIAMEEQDFRAWLEGAR